MLFKFKTLTVLLLAVGGLTFTACKPHQKATDPELAEIQKVPLVNLYKPVRLLERQKKGKRRAFRSGFRARS